MHSVGDRNSELYLAWVKETDGEKKQELLRDLVPRLRRHASKVIYLSLHERNDDIVSTALWVALRPENGFRGDSKFSTWFHRIVLNLCTDHLRKKLSKKEVQLETFFSDEGGLEENLTQDLHVKEIIERLDPEDAKLVQLRLEGYTFEEMAEIFGIDRRSILRRRTRLEEKLKEIL